MSKIGDLTTNAAANEKNLTHSSSTSPSAATLGPVASGGFFRDSSAESASANCVLSLSMNLKEAKPRQSLVSVNEFGNLQTAVQLCWRV